MSRPDVVLAGPSCAGKTSVANGLQNAGYTLVTARRVISQSLGGRALTRDEMQRRGAELEADSSGRWLAQAAAAFPRPVVLDAARTPEQIAAARELLSGCLVVFLTASARERETRFRNRSDPVDAMVRFAEIEASPIERLARSLEEYADMRMMTDNLAPEQVFRRVVSRLEELS